MKKTQEITDAIVKQGILPLFFNPSEEVSLEVLRAVYRAGMRAIEYTNRGDAALSNFKKMAALKKTEMPDMMLGVGTIKNMQHAEDYLAAGADFLVSPGYIPEVAAYCVSNDIFHGPGCMTPSEICAAENTGINFIKLFPGNILGTAFLSSIKDIFPKLLFMPTGGVDTTKENLESWFNAGACAVGMGSKLVSKKLMEAKDYATIEKMSKEVLTTIQSLR